MSMCQSARRFSRRLRDLSKNRHAVLEDPSFRDSSDGYCMLFALALTGLTIDSRIFGLPLSPKDFLSWSIDSEGDFPVELDGRLLAYKIIVTALLLSSVLLC